MSTGSSAAAAPSPVSVAVGGLRLAVNLVPRAAAERIAGLVDDGEGGVALKVAVTAPPVDGRANDALLRLLARRLRLPVRDFAVLRGASSRHKLIAISGDPPSLAKRIEEELISCLKPN